MKDEVRQIIEHYGMENQLGIAQEECAELIQAISKLRRAGTPDPELLAHLAEEVADVVIVCAQLDLGYELQDAVHENVRMKLRRQLRRIAWEDADHEKRSALRP